MSLATIRAKEVLFRNSSEINLRFCHCVIHAIVVSWPLCYPCFVLSSPNFYTNITYQFSGPFNIKKTNEQGFRQQYIFAARGDVTQFRHREVRWEGLRMLSK